MKFTINKEFKDELVSRIRSGCQLIWIYCHGDEERCVRTIDAILEERRDGQSGPKLVVWDGLDGIQYDAEALPEYSDPMEAMRAIPKLKIDNGVVLFHDMHLLLNARANWLLRRALIKLCVSGSLVNQDRQLPIIVMADTPEVHHDIKDYASVIEFKLPTQQELYDDVVMHVWESSKVTNPNNKKIWDCGEEVLFRISQALRGLSSSEATQALATAVVSAGGFLGPVLERIADAKASIFAKIEGMTFVPSRNIRPPETMAGYDLYLDFIKKRGLAYSRNARKIGIPTPRGVALFGLPGAGKTTMGRVTAKILGLDLITLKIGAMFDKYVGESERLMRKALNKVSASGNCVLLVDELEKALGAAHKNAATDSGVSGRMLSALLDFLQERDKDCTVFVIATMNRIDELPEELIRVGRFDRLFGANMPDTDERIQHIKIQLRRYGDESWKYSNHQLQLVAKATDNFTGAEIEEIVISALHSAHARAIEKYKTPTLKQCKPTIDDMINEANVLPTSARVKPAEISKLVELCRTMTVPVSSSVADKHSVGERKPIELNLN